MATLREKGAILRQNIQKLVKNVQCVKNDLVNSSYGFCDAMIDSKIDEVL